MQLYLQPSITYWCLYHQDPLLPESGDKFINVEVILSLDPLQHGVQRDEGACPAHTSAAVHQQQVLPVVRMRLPHSLDEVDHGDGIGGHSVVRPGQVVEQCHLKGGTLRLIRLGYCNASSQEAKGI